MARYRGMDREQRSRMTIRDIAELAGVSISTVSRAVNGRSDVSEETRTMVRRIAREHGYTASRDARGLSTGRTGLVGVTLPVIHPTYFSAIVASVAEALDEYDMRMVLCPTQHQHDRELSLIERLMHGTTDGAILVLPEESGSELRTLARRGYRYVVVDPAEQPDEDIPAVSAAHSAGADQAVRHLLGLGHRRIGAITGPRGRMATEERLRGYNAAMAGAGVLPGPGLVAESDWTVEGGFAAGARLLALADPPTAIFAFNDQMAIGAMRAARSRGRRIPEELSIVGFDDITEAQFVTPGLTTVRQPLAEMGRMAVSLLVRLLDDLADTALHVELATRLVVRDSTSLA
ncbi:MAG TPA: LacI family DNA-binding transcriptional regulator [Candidatus Dormibacteraeota bacterium]